MATYRSERIARTETIRASNFSTEEAYKESGIVEAKEWLTTKDERTDDECNDLDGKIIPLGKSFQSKKENGYETVQFPPIHVNCRCTLLPVVSA
jgi:SPP1 gp7 family putative phage head morphogenesis protein